MLVDGVPAKHPRRTLTLVRSGDRRSGSVDPLIWCADREDASKLGKQTFLFQGGLHGNP
jgi:hypothetical protein